MCAGNYLVTFKARLPGGGSPPGQHWRGLAPSPGNRVFVPPNAHTETVPFLPRRRNQVPSETKQLGDLGSNRSSSLSYFLFCFTASRPHRLGSEAEVDELPFGRGEKALRRV